MGTGGEQLPIQDGRKDFTRMPVDRHKLGAIVKMDEDFINDALFDLEGIWSNALPRASQRPRTARSSQEPA